MNGLLAQFPFGQKELYGLAYRTDFDLKNHTTFSGQELVYAEEGGEAFAPHVIEPTFGLDRTEDGVPNLSFAVCAPEPGPFPTNVPGFHLMADDGLDRVAEADLIGVPALPRTAPLDPRVVEAYLGSAHA